MKKDNQMTAPVYKLWQRVTAFFTLVFFLLQTTSVAIASTLSAADIEISLGITPEFERADSGSYQYVAASTLLDDGNLGLRTIEDFYARLYSEWITALGEPIYVPISVGEITTIIPTYDNPPAVGSEFVQGRYVRNQIHDLLGRHLIDPQLDGFSSEKKQLETLYENAFLYAQSSLTQYGTVLQDAEDAGPVDMIWPEKHLINGQEVMVPIVYLTENTVAQYKVDGHEVQFNGEATFAEISVDGVDIKLGRDAFLRAVNDLTLENSSVASEDDLKLIAGGTMSLVSSLVEANGDVQIGAHSLQAKTLVHRYDLGHEHGTRFGEITEISSETGNVVVRSYGDIALQGVNVNAGDSIQFASDGSIYIGTLEDVSGEDLSGKWKGQKSSIDYLQSHLTAGESIELMAAGGIHIDAAEIVAGNGHIEILAGMGITIQDELGQFSQNASGRFGKKKVTESVYQTVAIRSLLDAGKGVKLHSDFGDITLKSVEINSTEGTKVKAENGGVNLLMTVETDHYSYSSVKKGLFTTKTVNKGHSEEDPVPNTIVGGFAVEALDGLHIQYEGDNSLSLDEQIEALSQIEGLEWMAQVRSETDLEVDWEAMSYKYDSWKESNRSLSPAFAAVLSIACAIAMGPAGLNVGAMVTTGGALGTAMSAGAVALASQATMAAVNGAVNGDIVDAMEDFASDDTLKSLATTMVTAGVIAQLDAAVFGLDADAVQSMEAAGATQAAIDSAMSDAISQSTQSLLAQSGQALMHATVQSSVSTIISGGSLEDLGDSFVQSVSQNGISVIGQNLSEEIGTFHKENNEIGQWDISDNLRYIAHAATGCLTGTLTSELNDSATEQGCVNGAGGAVIGEATADIFSELSSYNDLSEEGKVTHDLLERRLGDGFEGLTNEEFLALSDTDKALMASLYSINSELDDLKEIGVDLARLSAALGSFVAGAEAAQIQIAADAGENAAEHNGLFLIPLIEVGLAVWTAVEAYQAAERVLELVEKYQAGTLTDEEKEELMLDIIEVAGTEIFMTLAGKKIDAVLDILSDTQLGSAVQEKVEDLAAKLRQQKRDDLVNGQVAEKPSVDFNHPNFDFDDPTQVSLDDFKDSVDLDEFPEWDNINEEAYDLFQQSRWAELESLMKSNNVNGGYPPFDGAIATVGGKLKPGSMIDRIGGYDDEAGNFKDWGNFFAGLGEPFSNRSLAESRLDDVIDGNTHYKKYEILKEIDVTVGKAIPWEGQTGGGLQYQINITPPQGTPLIQHLINNGYIKELVD